VSTTRLVFVRHGEPEDDARGRCYGRLDVALSPRGVAQSAALAERLEPIPLSAVYTSPRRRARATADAICAGRSRTPGVDDRLCELDFGEFDGRAYAEIERDEPEFFRRWMSEPTAVRFPGGESYGELRERVASIVGELRRTHQGETIAIVTHGGVVRAALAETLTLPDRRIFSLDVGYCRVAVVDWFSDDPVVRVLNTLGDDVPAVLGER
jgi:alpha-ribazole phosphatase/probable phosphoglycerate mutase